jgi:hypothetical protein
VLGISRLWYAFGEGGMGSKMQAGAYVLERAPRQWRSILAEALALRRGEPSRYGSRLVRARDAVGFLRCALQECAAHRECAAHKECATRGSRATGEAD